MKYAAAKELHYERRRLNNGLVVLVCENGRLPLVSLNAFVLAGSAQNPLDRPGLAALTSRLLDEGTRKYEALQIAEIVESAGAGLSTFGERELSGIALNARTEDFSMGLDLLAEMLVVPLFQKDRFELERRKVMNRLQAMNDDPQIVGAHRLNQWICQGTPFQYPVLGTQESVRALTVEELRTFHLQNYAPQNTILVLVGAVKANDVFCEAAVRFSNWKNTGLAPRTIPSLERQRKPIFDEYLMEKEQTSIFVGHLGVSRNNPDFHRLQVMDVILGGGPGFTSRIPRRLRDEQGLAYTAYSDISGSSGLYPGRFVAFISTSPENRQRALDGLLAEIEDLVEKGVTAEELATAHDFLSGSFVFEFQSNGSVARYLLTAELFQLAEDYPRQYPKIIRSIDREQVHRVAREYLDTINYTTVVVGPTHDVKNSQSEPARGRGDQTLSA